MSDHRRNAGCPMRCMTGLLATGTLLACNPPSGGDTKQNGGEKLTILPIAYDWRDDPRCFAKGTKVGWRQPLDPEYVLWREKKRFFGFWSGTSEGSIFIPAISDERYGGLDFNRYQAQAYTRRDASPDPELTLEPAVFRVEFIGREALCNNQRPDEASNGPSTNVILADKFISSRRVR